LNELQSPSPENLCQSLITYKIMCTGNNYLQVISLTNYSLKDAPKVSHP
jgi:hypothetical protein